MSSTNGHLRTPTKRARGLGSAHEGTGHFWVQRVSALLLIPLTVWFVTVLIGRIIGGDASALAVWLNNPLNAIGMAAMILALFVHARLGIQVIIEDYVHAEGKKIACLLLNNLLILGFGALSLLSILQLHLSGN